MTADMIYAASDLDRKRREVTDTARHYDVLEAVSRWHDRLDVVERARAKPAPTTTANSPGCATSRGRHRRL
jgi:hypothetical protein